MHDDSVRQPRRSQLLRAAFSNWPLPAVLGFIDYRSNRLWPGGLDMVGDIRCDLHARSGARLVARVRDVNAPAEVFGRNEYDDVSIEWPEVRFVLDIGGHIGSFTLWAAARSPARFFTVEPNPAVFNLLGHNVARAGLADRVTLRLAAVGETRGRRWLELDADSAASRLRGADRTAQGVEVEVITLRDVLAEAGFPRVDVVKIDIEGAEYEALAGAGWDVLAWARHWIVECHPGLAGSADSMAALLEAAGLRVSVAMKPNGLALVTASC